MSFHKSGNWNWKKLKELSPPGSHNQWPYVKWDINQSFLIMPSIISLSNGLPCKYTIIFARKKSSHLHNALSRIFLTKALLILINLGSINLPARASSVCNNVFSPDTKSVRWYWKNWGLQKMIYLSQVHIWDVVVLDSCSKDRTKIPI